MHIKRVQLIAARARNNWTLNQASERIGCAPNTLSRWELGTLAPSAFYRERLCMAYGMTAEQLGLVESIGSFPVPSTDSAPQSYINANLTTRLLSLISNTQCDAGEIQQAIEHAFKMFTLTNPGQEQKVRDALHVLAMHPVAFPGTHEHISRSVDMVLNQYAAGIAACGYLSNGLLEDIQLASTMVTAYLPVLYTIKVEAPRYQKTASGLIAQALQIKSRSEEIEQALRSGEEAVYHARESGNRTILVTALRGLTADYEFGITDYPERAKKALHYAEEAQHLMEQKHGKTVPTLVQSWVYTGLAKYQAVYGLKQEMSVSLGKAEEAFFASSSTDSIPGSVSYSHAHLFRHKAITYAYFGEQDQAFRIFQAELIDINDKRFASKLPMAARNRLGVLSELTFTTLYLPRELKDKELSIALWKAKVEETKALHSESYFNEACIAYSVMKGIWSDDADIRELRDLLVHW